MNLVRCLRHLFAWPWSMQRCFPSATLAEIERAITASERRHGGELRFAIEPTLDPWQTLRGLDARCRALQVFANLHVWDTENNTGVLIYLLLAEHAIEIVADRGINRLIPAETWQGVSQRLRDACQQNDFRTGSVAAIEEISEILARHFPPSSHDTNELPDQPILIT